MLHDARLVVSNMFKLIWGGDIPQRKNAFNGGAVVQYPLILVHTNKATGIYIKELLSMQAITIWTPPGSHQHLIGNHIN